MGDTKNFHCLYNAKTAEEYEKEIVRIKNLIHSRERSRVHRFMLNLLLCNDGINGNKTTVVDEQYGADQTARDFKRTEGMLQFELYNAAGVIYTCLKCRQNHQINKTWQAKTRTMRLITFVPLANRL